MLELSQGSRVCCRLNANRPKACGPLAACYECCGKIEIGAEAFVSFVVSGCDSPEFLDFGEIVFDQMAPFVHFGVDLDKLFSVLSWWDDRECSARIELKPEPIGIESLIREQRVERHAVNQRPDPHDVVALARHQDKAHQIAEGIDQRHDFGR